MYFLILEGLKWLLKFILKHINFIGINFKMARIGSQPAMAMAMAMAMAT
jgi:hypothetical protein